MSEVHGDYVEGDVNTIDDRDTDEGVEAISDAPSGSSSARAVLEFIASSLADDPSAVSVEVSQRQGKTVLSLQVHPDDMGRVIGRRGRTAQAIRSLVAAAGARDGVNATVDIVD